MPSLADVGLGTLFAHSGTSPLLLRSHKALECEHGMWYEYELAQSGSLLEVVHGLAKEVIWTGPQA